MFAPILSQSAPSVQPDQESINELLRLDNLVRRHFDEVNRVRVVVLSLIDLVERQLVLHDYLHGSGQQGARDLEPCFWPASSRSFKFPQSLAAILSSMDISVF